MTARDEARILLLQRGVLDAFKGANDEDRAAFVASGAMETGDKITVKHGDEQLGKVELRAGAKKATVTDRAALMQWVAEQHPTMLVQPEDTAALRKVIARSTAGAALTDNDIVTLTLAADRMLGVIIRQGTQPRLGDTAEKALLDNVKENGGYLDQTTGEVTPVPGVEVTQGPPTPFVSPNRAVMPGVVAELLQGAGLRLPAIETGS